MTYLAFFIFQQGVVLRNQAVTLRGSPAALVKQQQPNKGSEYTKVKQPKYVLYTINSIKIKKVKFYIALKLTVIRRHMLLSVPHLQCLHLLNLSLKLQ